MGRGQTSEAKRSLSSPSLFSRLASSPRKHSSGELRGRWTALTSSRRLSRRPTMQDVAEDGLAPDGGFLPLIRVSSPLDPFKICDDSATLLPPQALPQHAQRDPHATDQKPKRSTSWTTSVAIFSRRSVRDEGTNRGLLINSVPNPGHGKRKPKFTLESPSDLDVSNSPSDSHTMSSSVLSPPVSTHVSPVPSSSSLSSAAGAPTLPLHLPPPLSVPLSRPHLVRRDASKNPSRRYTFAMAMTDEHISDEVLVKELERMRAVKAWTGSNPGSDLEELWDLGASSNSHSPGFGSSESSDNLRRGFFEGALTDSPPEQSGDEYVGIAVTTDTLRPQPLDMRASHRGSLPVFPVHQRYSVSSSISPSIASSAAPPNARASFLEASDVSWNTARRALLTCRECVRTERHYLAGMRSLVSQDTDTPPPILMLRYAERLVEMSQRLLARMEENPNVWGVTAAFLGEEAALEESFVGWCGKVGGWFEGNVEESSKEKETVRQSKPTARRLSKRFQDDSSATFRRWMKNNPGLASDLPSSGSSSSSSSSSTSASSSSTATTVVSTPATSVQSSPPASKGVTPSHSVMSSPTISFTNTLIGRKPKDASRMSSSSGVSRQRSDGSTSSAGGSSSGISSSGDGAAHSKVRKPAVRELAILPTQRVMRYVLLFRDLLAHTPSTSPARSMVERAVDAASRIAEKCDQAQNHAAFNPQVSPVKSNDSWTIQRTWSRRLSQSKGERESHFHPKAASDHGHSTTTQACASTPVSRAPSLNGKASSVRVLIKPRRNASTSAVSDVFAPPLPTPPKHEPNRLTKGKKSQANLKAPPPSSFVLKPQLASTAIPS